ncbi:MAG: DUF4256 domain-containing protein [Bacilli bacterium]
MNKLSNQNIDELLLILETRFKNNMKRHPNHTWNEIKHMILQKKSNLQSLFMMESSLGEPDLVYLNNDSLTYVDCSLETPKGRINTCYDDEALEKRKKFKPLASSVGLANSMGITLLNFEEYKELQKYGPFDQKTSSWLNTPTDIRVLGGAIFGDFRYNTVFMYHNGADSYYSSRGFRGKLVL